MKTAAWASLPLSALLLICGCDTLGLSKQGREIERQRAAQFDKAWVAMKKVIGQRFTIRKEDPVSGQIVAMTAPELSIAKTRQKVIAHIVDSREGWYEVEVRVMTQVETSTPDAFGTGPRDYEWRTIDFDEPMELRLMKEITRELGEQREEVTGHRKSSAGQTSPQANAPTLQEADPGKVSEPRAIDSRKGPTSHLAFIHNRPSPKDPLSRALIVGDMYFRDGNYEGADEQYRIAQQADPGNPVPCLAVGHARFAMGDYPEAARALRTALTTHKHWATLRMDRRDFYRDPQTFLEHLAALEQKVKEQPNNPDGLFLLGYNYYYSGRPSLAAQAFKRLLEIQPDDPLAKAFLRLLGPEQVI